MGKRLDVLGKTLRRFRKNVRTFQVKRLDVFFRTICQSCRTLRSLIFLWADMRVGIRSFSIVSCQNEACFGVDVYISLIWLSWRITGSCLINFAFYAC